MGKKWEKLRGKLLYCNEMVSNEGKICEKNWAISSIEKLIIHKEFNFGRLATELINVPLQKLVWLEVIKQPVIKWQHRKRIPHRTLGSGQALFPQPALGKGSRVEFLQLVFASEQGLPLFALVLVQELPQCFWGSELEFPRWAFGSGQIVGHPQLQDSEREEDLLTWFLLLSFRRKSKLRDRLCLRESRPSQQLFEFFTSLSMHSHRSFTLSDTFLVPIMLSLKFSSLHHCKFNEIRHFF